MGSVFKAHDEKLERSVALKFITGGFSKDDDKKRFIREAQAAASLQHPNICPIYEVDEFEGRIFFVMAYLEGRTLGELVEDGPLPIEQAVNIARQVASGLEGAHEHGIVHRDIKSSNVVVNAKGRGILLDFGLAQRAGQSRLTATGAAMGTARHTCRPSRTYCRCKLIQLFYYQYIMDMFPAAHRILSSLCQRVDGVSMAVNGFG